MPSTPPLVVAHIGAFDLASYGDQLFPLVAAHELGRRVEGVELVPFGPVGADGLAWALGPWSEQRAAQLAGSATAVLCGGGEIVQGEGTIYGPFYGLDPADAADLNIDRWFLEALGRAEDTCPVIWNGPGVPAELDPATAERVRQALGARTRVAVRDDRSRRLLEAAGIERDIAVVPDAALLMARLFPPAELDRWRDRLRAAGHFPARPHDPSGPGSAGAAGEGDAEGRGPVIVVQGNHTMSGLAGDLAAALAELAPTARIVTVSVSPCHDDQRFARALADHSPGRVWSVPEDSPVEAVAAAIAGADCFLGVSLHGAITALSYGRPFVTLDPFDQGKLAGFVDLVGWPEARTSDPGTAARRALAHTARAHKRRRPPSVLAQLQARIDAHFDQVAEIVQAAARPLLPLGWDDTATPLHLRLRRPPRPVMPVPATTVPAIRRPHVTPTEAELLSTLAATVAARAGRREEQIAATVETERLRRENGDLRGALAHLEGMLRKTERDAVEWEGRREEVLAELRHLREVRRRDEQILSAARSGLLYRLTRRPWALRRSVPGEGDEPSS